MKHRIQRLEQRVKARMSQWMETLEEGEYLVEFLRSVEQDYGVIHRETAEALIVGMGGEMEDWQEELDKVLTERCEQVGRHTWRFKREEK